MYLSSPNLFTSSNDRASQECPDGMDDDLNVGKIREGKPTEMRKMLHYEWICSNFQSWWDMPNIE